MRLTSDSVKGMTTTQLRKLVCTDSEHDIRCNELADRYLALYIRHRRYSNRKLRQYNKLAYGHYTLYEWGIDTPVLTTKRVLIKQH